MAKQIKNSRKVKIVGVSLSDTKMSRQIVKLVEKSKAMFVYYGNDMRHYEVYDGAEKELK